MSDDPITYREYRNEIESIVDSIIEEREEGDELTELVSNFVDSHQWVLHNSYHPQVLRHTSPDEWSHLVADDERNHHKVLQAMTFSAMRADVWEELHERGITE